VFILPDTIGVKSDILIDAIVIFVLFYVNFKFYIIF